MGYAAPIGTAVNFEFLESGYAPPAGESVQFDFTEGVTVTPDVALFHLASLRGAVLPILAPAGILHAVPLDSGIAAPIPIYVAATRADLILTGYAPALSMVLPIPVTGIPVQGKQPAAGALLRGPEAGPLHLLGQAPDTSMGVVVPAGIFRLLPLDIVPISYILSIPAAAVLQIAPLGPGRSWSVDQSKVRVVYRFVLTGAPDGLADVIIPISSIQGRSRDGKPTYLSAVIPTMDYASQVSARTNGEMILSRGYQLPDDQTTWQEISRADLSSIRMDEGAKSASITLTGYATTSNDSPKSVTLTGASYRNIGEDGKRRYRCALNMFLQPGDTAIVNGESFVVGTITYTIGTKSELMEIAEA